MECEYHPSWHGFLEDELLGKRNYDYLLGASHFYEDGDHWHSSFSSIKTLQQLRLFVEQTIATMESGLFVCIAHPDLFAASVQHWNEDVELASRDICEAALELDVLLELNAYGTRKPKIHAPEGPRAPYPWSPFWRVAGEVGVKTIIGSDAHRPEDVAHGADTFNDMIEAFGLASADVYDRLSSNTKEEATSSR